jgi:hypothetical protein
VRPLQRIPTLFRRRISAAAIWVLALKKLLRTLPIRPTHRPLQVSTKVETPPKTVFVTRAVISSYKSVCPNCGMAHGAGAERADTEPEGADSRAPAASSLRRSKRLRPFYVDREAEPASSSAARRTRETRELLTTPPRATTGARAQLLLVQISPSSSDSEASAASTLASDDEFADDNFPPTHASSPRTYTIPTSAANCASSVSPPRAHRRKQIRPYRCPVA